MKLRTALSMLVGLVLIGGSDVFGGTCETQIRSSAYLRTSSLNVGTNAKLKKARDLVLVGTVREIHSRSGACSLKNWIVVVDVARIVSGEFSGTTFSFAIHSPARAGLQVGQSYTVKATWIGAGYLVDELQWQKPR